MVSGLQKPIEVADRQEFPPGILRALPLNWIVFLRHSFFNAFFASRLYPILSSLRNVFHLAAVTLNTHCLFT